MSRQSIISHYTRLLARWPKDALRPEKTFQQVVLEPRLKAAPSAPPAGVTAESITNSGSTSTYARNETDEVNAAYLLLENNFSKQFPPGQRLMQPASNPQHYVNLERELAVLPTRSVFGNFVERLKNMVRFK
ncbi:Putative cytochrome B pre-mRNA-processing protein [Septoria linicola]|uniref:Cytochrome B pre-mRNA-processing protein n=1 Tax=Septoria linicola TaxID=215465 RepID=A0A9Q9B819_9PEZI|nr:putative cytochrome B pre-mRNA-processing protein [Septoria linicola]USW59113.1 Putative cytochrome B pre-mRNA-processing protein [Septoria linicola]